jgi:hypothetical protein
MRGPPAAPAAGQLPWPSGPYRRRRPALNTQIPKLLLVGGVISFLLTKLDLSIPSIQAILMAGRNLAVIGVCLGLWMAWQRKDRQSAILWIAMTVVVPVAYLVGWGFMSYGFTAMAIFLAFWLAVPRAAGPQNTLLRACLIAFGMYVSLSLFVGYMEVRSSLRDVLWNSDASLSQRFSIILSELSVIRPLNPLNFTQLDWINMRLNQNMLIGKAMWLHEIAPYLKENGMGILSSLFAWVPRFLWPSKPDMGGNDFVEKHTGMTFSDGTTIGAGPVFELLVNFGLVGVFIGSIVLGWVLRWMDIYCARQLRRCDMGRFIRGYLVGVCLINPMSLIFFLVSSAGAAWILGSGVMLAMDLTGQQTSKSTTGSDQYWKKRFAPPDY